MSVKFPLDVTADCREPASGWRARRRPSSMAGAGGQRCCGIAQTTKRNPEAEDRVPVRADVHGEDEAGLVDQARTAVMDPPVPATDRSAPGGCPPAQRGRRRPRPDRTRPPQPWDPSTVDREPRHRRRRVPDIQDQAGLAAGRRKTDTRHTGRRRSTRPPRRRRWRARRDSNSRPLGPQPNALSTELRAPDSAGRWRRGRDRTLEAGYPTWRFSKPLH